jgi:hypothetical protein
MAEETGTPAAASEGEPAADAKGTEELHPSADDNQPAADDKPAADAAPTDDKPADDKPAEDADKPKEGEDANATAAVTAEFKMPEGMELDTEAAEKFAPMAQELGLDQEQAQKLVDFYAEERQKLEKANVDVWEKTQADWQELVKSDEEVGGADLEEKLGVATKALEKFGTPALNDAILAMGAGNNVEFIRFTYRVGKAMSEDTIGTGTPAPKNDRDRAKILFPDQN